MAPGFGYYSGETRRKAYLVPIIRAAVNPETLKKLSEISTTDHLRSAITDLCLPYGKVKKIDLIPLDQGTGYLCFVELDSTGQYASLTYELDGTIYGNSIAFKIPFGQRGN